MGGEAKGERQYEKIRATRVRAVWNFLIFRLGVVRMGDVEVVVQSEVSPRQLLVSVGSSFVCMFVVLSEPQTFYALLSLITKKRK